MERSATAATTLRSGAAGAILVFATTISLVACSSTPPEPTLPPGDTAALRVDATPVSLEAYASCVRDALPSVLGEAEGVGQGNDLGAALVDGRPALAVVRERGAAECGEDVVRRSLGVELGVIEDATLESSRARWELHNEQRRQRADAGEIVYGPLELAYEDFDAIEQAEFATTAELPLVDALLADPNALDAAVDGPVPTGDAERRIAAQAVAREQVETQRRDAVAAATIEYADWLDEVAVGSIIER